jgi:hypothetical protein
MTRIYESDIAKALYEAISIGSWEAAEEAISSLRTDLQDCNFELHESDAAITISTETEDFRIVVYKTRTTNPL